MHIRSYLLLIAFLAGTQLDKNVHASVVVLLVLASASSVAIVTADIDVDVDGVVAIAPPGLFMK